MRDITDQVENISLQVTSEDNGEGGRTVQVHLTGPGGGSFKQQLDLQGDVVKWVSIPLKIIDGHVCIG